MGDFDAWKPMFDSDGPGARKAAKGYRLLRGVENPNEVFIIIEYGSQDDATVAREKLLAWGVLDRFQDKSGPTLAEEAESVGYKQ